MDERRKTGGVGVIVAILLCLLFAVLYGVGYFALADSRSFDRTDGTAIGSMMREYPHSVFVRLYYPAAVVEAKVGDHTVVVWSGDGTALDAQP
jgi:hypothetical protein